MVKIMNRTTKSTSSLANIFLTGMVVIGFYILYRYVKSLELDLKQLKIENSNVKNTITSLENMMYTNSTNYSNININDINNKDTNHDIDNNNINDDNDDESIKSDEIDTIIKNINQEEDDDDQEDDKNKDIDNNNDNNVENNENLDEIVEDISSLSTPPVTINVEIDRKSELQLLTNDELKKIIKTLGSTGKGNKSELIEKIIELEK